MFKELIKESNQAEKDASKLLDIGNKLKDLLTKCQSKYRSADMAISCKDAYKHINRAVWSLKNIEIEAEEI